MTLIEKLYEALDNMDDYALMATIKPIGQHAVLTKGIQRLEQAEKVIAELTEATRIAEPVMDTYAGDARYQSFKYALASAKAWKEGT